MASYWTLQPIVFINPDGNVEHVAAHRSVTLTAEQATALGGSVIRLAWKPDTPPTGGGSIDPALLAQINAAIADVATLKTGKQAADADLTAIANLTPVDNDFLQRKSGAWANRTPTQVKADLAFSKTDVGLGSVDNTADASKSVASAAKLTTARNIDGQAFDGTANVTIIAPSTHAATSKTTPVDADEIPLADSAGSWGLKKLTWANLKATIKAALTKADVGLGNVDNTADSAKAVLSATKLTTPRTINGISFDGTANITVVDNSKEPAITAGTSAQYWRGDKAMATLDKTAVGLGNVTNNPQYYPGGADVAVADGGTGSSTAAGARSNLGLGSSAVLPASHVNVMSYGAVGDGAADDTTALNNAKAAAVAAGLPLYIPKGTYKITSTLDWMVNDLIVIGDGSRLSQIQQATANTIVAKVAGQHQRISGLGFRFVSQQTSAQTSAIGLAFGDDTVGSCFQSEFRDLRFVNCATPMQIHPTGVTTVAGLFSCQFYGIDLPSYSISAINFTGGNDTGAYATGCTFNNVYLNNATDGTTCSSYAILLKDWDEVVFNQLNIEHGTVNTTDVFGLIRVNNLVVNDLHFEKITASSDGAALVYLSNSRAVINSGTARFNTFSGATSNPVFRMFGTSKLVVNNWVDNSNTRTTPSRPVIDFGSATNSSALLNHIDLGQTTARRTGGDSTDFAIFHDEIAARAGRIASITSSATPSINCDATDQLNITALGAPITSITVTGTPRDGQELTIRFKDDGTARAITHGSVFTGTLLTTTVAGKTHVCVYRYDATAAKWAGIVANTSGY